MTALRKQLIENRTNRRRAPCAKRESWCRRL